MWPTLRPGYQIRFQFTDPETLDAGDLLVIRSLGRKGESHTRVHRLLGRAGPFFVEAGDNTYSAALVHPDDILGRVVSVRTGKGKPVKFVSASKKLDRRFRFFLHCAHAFMFAHECKNRLIGDRRSLILWRVSQVYRASLGAAGLKVPAISPV